MDIPCQRGMYAYAPPQAPSSQQGLYLIGLLLFVAFCVWFFSPPCAGVYGASQGGTPQHQAADGPPQRPFNQPHGSLPAPAAAASGNRGCANSQAKREPARGPTRAENDSWGAAVPTGNSQSPRVPASLFSSTAAGSPIDDATYAASPETAQYYEHFKPVSLESTMPMGWRSPGSSAECGGADDELYGEFSRYAITPNQMKRAENMKSVLRLGELSREGLSRTLGQRSLLRDYVTPLGPSPIGDSAMLWNDSSVRQNYIASATGRFPEVAQSC
jgi:hypothetical protein